MIQKCLRYWLKTYIFKEFGSSGRASLAFQSEILFKAPAAQLVAEQRNPFSADLDFDRNA